MRRFIAKLGSAAGVASFTDTEHQLAHLDDNVPSLGHDDAFLHGVADQAQAARLVCLLLLRGWLYGHSRPTGLIR
jgi:hypothetical protein